MRVGSRSMRGVDSFRPNWWLWAAVCVGGVVTVAVELIAFSCTPCTESEYDRARRFETRRTPCSNRRRRPCWQIEPPPHSLHESADDRARRFQTHRTPCIDCAHDRARRVQTHRTPGTESASSVGTSTAHLALRPILHPVLAWPLRGRGSLPLHSLLRRILLSSSLSDPSISAMLARSRSRSGSPNRRHLPCEILRLFVFPMVVRGRFDVDGGGVVVVVGLFLDDDGVPVQQVWVPDGAHGARRYEL